MVPVGHTPDIKIVKTNEGVVDTHVNGYDDAGDTVKYDYDVTNTGNVTLLDVTADDDKLDLISLSGLTDEDGDGVKDDLAVGATVKGSATATLTQADIDRGSLQNVVIATGIAGLPLAPVPQVVTDDDTNTVDFDHFHEITLVKDTVYKGAKGDGLTGVTAGDAIGWEYSVENTGAVTLFDVTVKDDAGTVGTGDDFYATAKTSGGFNIGDTNSNGNLDVGEKWTFTASGVAVVGSYTNTGTVTSIDTAKDTVSDTDTSSYTAKTTSGQIAPTNTTMQQYIDGTATSFTDYYAAQGGVIQYSVKAGLINSTNPGVFYYFTGLSNTIKGYDGADAGTAPDSMSILIDQSDNSIKLGAFTTSASQVQLWKITDNNHDNAIDSGDTATKIQLSPSQIILGTGANAGDVSINFTPDAVGSLYAASVKYTTSSVVRTNVGSSAWPTVKYSFSTDVSYNGAAHDATPEETGASVDLAPKFAALLLNGDAIQGGNANVLDDATLNQVIDYAISYWEGHGTSVSDVAELKSTHFNIGNLGGNTLGEWTGSEIVIDDNADGYGWSTSLNSVDSHQVDLFSVVMHEMAHVLGYEHGDHLDSSLMVGSREMPLIDTVANADAGNQADLIGVPYQVQELYAA